MVPKIPRKFLTALAGMTAIMSFLILSSVAVVWANGLRFNSTTGSFEQTVLIAIESQTDSVEIWLDGKLINNQIPYSIRNLLPGHYTIELKKSGYQTWRQSFWLPKGQIGLITDPVLIALFPLVSVTKLPFTISSYNQTDFGLKLSSGELTDNGELVTRFSQNPLQVHRFNDYYLYQNGDELRLFIKTGSQDYLIYRSPISTFLPLALLSSTWQVAVQEGEVVKLINLRIPSRN